MAFLADEAARRVAESAARLTPKSPAEALWSGVRGAAGLGLMTGVGIMAYEVSKAQRGEVVPSLLGHTGGLVTYPALSGAIAAGGALAASALGIPPVGIGLFAAAAALYPEVWVGTQLNRGIRTLAQGGRHLRELEFGGAYIDNPTNEALRTQALYEMSGASSSARRYLGQEARFFHR